jgi:hypothetical protein
MSLHLTNAETTTPAMVRLPASFMPTIKEFAAAQEAKKQADAAARAADATMRGLQGALEAAMQGQDTAVCEHVVLALTHAREVPATLTLSNGSKIAWTQVTGLTVGNAYVAATDVTTLFGGRSGYTRLNVKGA